MLARVQSYLLQGIDALPCEVEVSFDEREGMDSSGGGPVAVTVGLPDAGVRESHERVRSAVTNSGYTYGPGKTLVNLAPADVRKEGPLYDLPIAIGLLISKGIIRLPGGRTPVGAARGPSRSMPGAAPVESPHEPLDFRKLLFGGELALDGRLRPIKGAIALAALAKAKGYQGVVVPSPNATEAAVVQGVEVFGANTLSEVVGWLTGDLEAQPVAAPDVLTLLHNAAAPIDFAEVRGQESVKRAIVVAAAGGHNLLGLWPSDRRGLDPCRQLDCEPASGRKPPQPCWPWPGSPWLASRSNASHYNLASFLKPRLGSLEEPWPVSLRPQGTLL